MKYTNSQKSQIGILYARCLLDKVGLLPFDSKNKGLVYYAKRINQLRRNDLNIVHTKNASRDYLFKLFMNNINIEH